MELKSSITGGRDLDELLRQLPPRIARQAAGNALRAGARIVRDQIRQDREIIRQARYANPRHDARDRPKLKDSIRIITVRDAKPGTRLVRVGFFGKASPLAHIMEFGTVPIRKAKKAGGFMYFVINGRLLRKKVVRGVRGKGVIKRAADVTRKAVVEAIGEGIATSVERIGNRARQRDRRRIGL